MVAIHGSRMEFLKYACARGVSFTKGCSVSCRSPGPGTCRLDAARSAVFRVHYPER